MTPRSGTQIALITGAASGIGLALTAYFLSLDVVVIAIDTDPDLVTKISQAIPPSTASDLASRLEAVQANVTSWDQQRAAVQQGIKRFGRLDYVVPCAGIGERPWLPLTKTALAASEGEEAFVKPDLSVIDVDLTGVLYTVALGVQQFQKQTADEDGRRGQVILIASICGIYAIPGFPMYTAAKHALVGLTRSYAAPLQRAGILINAVCPAVVRTNISTSQFYDKLETASLLTPLTTIVSAVERILDAHDAAGSLYECGPNGVEVRTLHETAIADAQTQELCDLLEQRAGAGFDLSTQ